MPLPGLKRGTVNYIAEASKRYPLSRVIGDGRWAVVCSDGRLVYLCADERQQKNVALGASGPTLVDLTVRDILTITESMPDDWEDRQYERRQKRAEKFNAQY